MTAETEPPESAAFGSEAVAYSKRLSLPSPSGSAKSPLIAGLFAFVPKCAKAHASYGSSTIVKTAVDCRFRYAPPVGELKARLIVLFGLACALLMICTEKPFGVASPLAQLSVPLVLT